MTINPPQSVTACKKKKYGKERMERNRLQISISVYFQASFLTHLLETGRLAISLKLFIPLGMKSTKEEKYRNKGAVVYHHI